MTSAMTGRHAVLLGLAIAALLARAVAYAKCYAIQTKVPDSTTAGQKRRLVAAANAALQAGPR